MSGIFHEIGNVFDEIGHAIASAFSQIGEALYNVLKQLGDFILRNLERFWHFLTHNVIAVAIIVIVVAAIITYYDPEIWFDILEFLETAATTVGTYIEDIGQWLMYAWEALKTSWANSVGPYVSDALSVMQDLQGASEIYADVKSGHYLEGLRVLFTDVLPEMSSEFDTKIQTVINQVSKDFNTYQNVISNVQSTIAQFGAGLSTLATEVADIGTNFGAKGITDIGDSIQGFVNNQIDGAINALNSARSDLSAAFNVAMSPLIQWDMQYHALLQNQQDVSRRLAGLTLAGLKGSQVFAEVKPFSIAIKGDAWDQVIRWRQEIATKIRLL